MMEKQSPEYVRMSLAAAMTLGFKPGLFYRDARLYCINLLLTYDNGCRARCAYCGLSGNRPGNYADKSFIRVTWPLYTLADVAECIHGRKDRVKRICLSMITRNRAVPDTIAICCELKSRLDIPISILVSPTVLKNGDLAAFKTAGADKIGVAVDLAAKSLFDRYRGKGVGGPHQWERYWECLEQGIEVFGKGNAGPHLMTGMGETEKQMCDTIQRSRDMGGRTHLFSFFPEAESAMADHAMPPMDQYRRIQIARYMIDEKISRADIFNYNDDQQITDFGVSGNRFDRIVDSGEPFRTSGCTGKDGEVACNRPYANSRPGPDIRNFPFAPDREDVLRIRKQMTQKE